MKIIHHSLYSILYSINKAYQGLKVLLDPAMEGNPYDDRPFEVKKEVKSFGMSWMPRRRFSFR